MSDSKLPKRPDLMTAAGFYFAEQGTPFYLATNADGEVFHTNEWQETTPLSAEELAGVQAKLVELTASYEATLYRYQRAEEYPSIGDQLDALWKGGEAAAAMLAQVQAVKAKYPKE